MEIDPQKTQKIFNLWVHFGSHFGIILMAWRPPGSPWPARVAQEAILASFWGAMDSIWATFKAIWEPFGTLWGLLDVIWGFLGRLLVQALSGSFLQI